MPTSKPAFFFSSTQSVDDRLGDIFSFIWGNYAGLRDLWWQVRGFKEQFPELHISAIEKKILAGLPMPGGIDFQKTFIEKDWNEHEREFSRWIIFDACTLMKAGQRKYARTYLRHLPMKKTPRQYNILLE